MKLSKNTIISNLKKAEWIVDSRPEGPSPPTLAVPSDRRSEWVCGERGAVLRRHQQLAPPLLKRHPRQDSNLQPPDLKTGALSVELLGFAY